MASYEQDHARAPQIDSVHMVAVAMIFRHLFSAKRVRRCCTDDHHEGYLHDPPYGRPSLLGQVRFARIMKGVLLWSGFFHIVLPISFLASGRSDPFFQPAWMTGILAPGAVIGEINEGYWWAIYPLMIGLAIGVFGPDRKSTGLDSSQTPNS